MRLIDADALPKYTGYALSANEVAKAVENAPTIEAEPVRRGRWYIPKDYPSKTYRRICTACQDVAYYCGEGNYRYCPNCGALMEEQE